MLPLDRRGRCAVVAIVLALVVPASAYAQPIADFYRGKTVSMVISSSPGGGYDTLSRVIARFLGRHIPGNPSVVPQNMPGASGIKSATYLYQIAPKDGATIGTFNQSMGQRQVLEPQSVQFDVSKFNWIGAMASSVNVFITWHASGVKTIEDAKRKEVVMGALSDDGGNAVYPFLLNKFLGTKFKVVLGYQGGNTIQLAMERGEVQGDGSARWSSWKSTKPEWVRDKKISALVQIGLKKDDDLPDVPLLTELAQNPEQRMMFDFISQPIAMQQPFVGPPGTPADRVIILRRGFDAMTEDPDFRKEVEQLDLELDPVAGEDVQRIVRAIVGTPPAIVEKVQAATAVKPEHGKNGSVGE